MSDVDTRKYKGGQIERGLYVLIMRLLVVSTATLCAATWNVTRGVTPGMPRVIYVAYMYGSNPLQQRGD